MLCHSQSAKTRGLWQGAERLTCAHPCLGAGAVDGDAGIQDLHRLHHQAVGDWAEELCWWPSKGAPYFSLPACLFAELPPLASPAMVCSSAMHILTSGCHEGQVRALQATLRMQQAGQQP